MLKLAVNAVLGWAYQNTIHSFHHGPSLNTEDQIAIVWCVLGVVVIDSHVGAFYARHERGRASQPIHTEPQLTVGQLGQSDE